jgi:hypothetical protein
MSHGDLDPSGIGHRLKSVIWGLVALALVGPALAQLISSLIPAIVVIAVVAAGLRALWFYTGRW